MTKSQERSAVFVFGVFFVAIMIVLAIVFPNPTPFMYLVFRSVLALAAAGVAAFIPGFLNVEIGKYIRAGGAIAVFVIVYWFSPAQILIPTPEEARAANIEKWRSIVTEHNSHTSNVVIDALQNLVRENVSLEEVDLSGANLSDAKLVNANLNGALFVGSDLRRAELKGSRLANTDFSHANLEFAVMSDINPSNYSPVLLDGMAVIVGGSLAKHGAELEEDNRARAESSKKEDDPSYLKWDQEAKTILDGANLRNADLTGANLSGGSFNKTDFFRAEMINVNLDNADIVESVLMATDLSGSSLVNTNLRGTALHSAKLDNAKLVNANLSGVGMCAATARGTNFTNATILLEDWIQYSIAYNCGFGSMNGHPPLCRDDRTVIATPEGGEEIEHCSFYH